MKRKNRIDLRKFQYIFAFVLLCILFVASMAGNNVTFQNVIDSMITSVAGVFICGNFIDFVIRKEL